MDAPIAGLFDCLSIELVVVSTLEREAVDVTERCFGLGWVGAAVAVFGSVGSGGRVSLDFCAGRLPKLYALERDSRLNDRPASRVGVTSELGVSTLGVEKDRSGLLSPGLSDTRLLKSGAGLRATDGDFCCGGLSGRVVTALVCVVRADALFGTSRVCPLSFSSTGAG